MARRSPQTLSLFDWTWRAEVEAIEVARQELLRRMAKMRWRSDRRRKLEDELRQITTKQLRLSVRHEGN